MRITQLIENGFVVNVVQTTREISNLFESKIVKTENDSTARETDKIGCLDWDSGRGTMGPNQVILRHHKFTSPRARE